LALEKKFFLQIEYQAEWFETSFNIAVIFYSIFIASAPGFNISFFLFQTIKENSEENLMPSENFQRNGLKLYIER